MLAQHGHCARNGAQETNGTARRKLRVESLERRQLLSVSHFLSGDVLTIFATMGNDQIDAFVEADQLHVQVGEVTVSVAHAAVRHLNIFARAGDDEIQVDDSVSQTTALWGGNGDDVIRGSRQADLIFGEAGNDAIDGNAGRDRLWGNAGHDELFGGGDNDLLSGGFGDDRLFGEDGNDALFGDHGRDYFDGGAGRDLIWALDWCVDSIVADGEDAVFKHPWDVILLPAG